MREGSKMVIIVPSFVLVSKFFEDLRHTITNLPYETKIVSLPKSVSGKISVAFSIIFMDGGSESDKIKFVDANEYIYTREDIDSMPSSFYPFGDPIDFLDDIFVNYISISNLCYHDIFPKDDSAPEEGVFQFGSDVWVDNCHATDGIATKEFGDQHDDDLDAECFNHDIRIIKKSIIIANNTSLNPSDYFIRPVVAPEGYDIYKLGCQVCAHNSIQFFG